MREATGERFLIQPFDAVDVDDGVEVAIDDNLRKKVRRGRWRKEDLVIAG